MKINNINTYTDLELALMVLLNYLGTGATRKKKLGARYKAVQELVNNILDHNVIPAGTGNTTIEELNKVLLELEPTHEDYLDYIDEIIDMIKEGTK